MLSLQKLLNPKNEEKGLSSPTLGKRVLGTQRPLTPSVNQSPSSSKETECQSEEAAAPAEHNLHPDCPDSLDCLADTDGRPQHTLPIILRCTILGSSKKRLTIREIYAAMEAKFPYYKTAGPTWKQSVRHHLSLNRLFERQPRPVNDPGFGSYWTVNLLAPPGTKRPRKRGRTRKDSGAEDAPQAKRRGRPRKIPIVKGESSMNAIPESLRPNSSLNPKDSRFCGSGNIGTIPFLTDDDFLSEEEFESEEDMSHIGNTGFVHKGELTNNESQVDNSDGLLDQLRIEVASLKRQSGEAVAVSLRITDQLAEAQADASRARSALHAAEEMLEEETRRRREAERTAYEETRLRHLAEETLKQIESHWKKLGK